jgi:hypothetical protein
MLSTADVKQLAMMAIALLLTACSESYAVISDQAPDKSSFTTTLSGANEVPAVSTTASGWANFVLEDAQTLQYDLYVAGIDSITMAHFHAAPAGQNGPIVAWFVPSEAARAAGPGSISVPAAGGILRQNRVSRASLAMVAPFTWDSLVTRMRAGTLYLNVRNRRNPGGELRGNIVRGRRE